MYQKCTFINRIINKDLQSGKYTSVCTRFPPEPNGYLHIGHAKSIFLNFGIAKHYRGKCNLRFDDTNPEKEHKKYIESIKYDIQWLGFTWNGDVCYTSDYSEKLYNYAIELIQKGLAYVDELSANEIKRYRGTLTCPGMNSPYRSRSIKDNLVYFSKMRDGVFSEKSACLRAKINMSSSVIVMRDPILYRIKYVTHHRIGNDWCIYPTYDFSHCIADAIEGITHSLCTLEFQDNRLLYNWILNNISINSTIRPTQYEFARLNLEYIITSKRKLNILVKKNIVDGWDDPRMPTISGLRRKGYTPHSIREFCSRIGISKQSNQIELSALEACIRADLNKHAPRRMAVLNPIKIKIKNLPEKYEEVITMPNHPNNSNMGVRNVIFSQEIFIDHFDFCETIKENIYSKLILGAEVKLRYAYIIKAEYIEKDKNGKILCIHCSYDPYTLQYYSKCNRKINGVIHWVSAKKNIAAEFRLYEKLFLHPNPIITEKFIDNINPNSLKIYRGFVETNVLNSSYFGPYQFERLGYFIINNRQHYYIYDKTSYLIFNRTATLKNSKIYQN